MKLRDNSLTPLYRQVLEDIKGSISSGQYAPGNRIPSEAELSELYDVSRVTVRRAIEELVSEGYLTKRQGKGTYVNQRKLAHKICRSGNAQSFESSCADMGMAPAIVVLERRMTQAHGDERSFFGPDYDKLVYLALLYTADGVPIMEEHSLFDYNACAFLLEDDLSSASFFELIERNTGKTPADHPRRTIETGAASVAMASELEVSAGDPLMLEHIHYLDQTGAPLCASTRYVVGARALFVL